jgi:predicted transposase YbfD/YdcC
VRGEELLGRVRQYWGIEGSLHQGLDVSCGEDASRVRNRNALLVRAAFCGGASFGLGPG